MSNRPPVPPITNQFPIVNDSGQPTDYFIRWLQERGFEIDGMLTPERVRELIDEWSATRAVNTGLGLSGGGTLDNDLTLSLNAALGDLNDVDLSTPPTDGQVIAYDAGAGLWLPVDQSGGGGGGGGGLAAWVQFVPGSPPTIQGSEGITSVTRTNTGRYRITFNSAFADNNYIIAASARFGDSTTTDTTPIIGVDRRTGFGKTTGYVDITITTDAAVVSDNLTFVNVGFMPAKVSSGGGSGGGTYWGWGFVELLDPSDIVATTTAGLGSGSIQNAVANANRANWWWWSSGQTLRTVTFDFGSPIVISGILAYQDNTSSNGTWQVEWSDDNSTWTAITSPITWGGATRFDWQFSNSTPHRYWRLVQTSGATSNSAWQQGFMFRFGPA